MFKRKATKKMSKADLKTKIDHIKIKDNSFLIVKVGSDPRPATDDDLKQIQETFEKSLGDKFPDLPIVVTHHCMDVKLYTCK